MVFCLVLSVWVSVKISCRVNTGTLGMSTPVLFEVDEHGQWPSGVEVPDTLLVVKGGTLSANLNHFTAPQLVRQIGVPKSMFTYHIEGQFHFGFILLL